jgi:pyruvate/2-oxoglutarate dehydrogenase complex dihydrolipoamide acyltransferase (E2) component
MFEFKLPDVGEGIAEAELIEWLVELGQSVEEGDPIAFVGTDKVNVELPSPRTGVIRELRFEEGAIVDVGDVVVTIEVTEDGTGQPAAGEGSPAPVTVSPATTAPVASTSPAPATALTPAPSPPTGRPLVAAPSTRRYAADRGIDLERVTGSGPAGRILREDVDRAAAATTGTAAAAPIAQPRPPTPTGEPGAVRLEPLRGARAVAAERMARSARETATATTTFEVDADELLRVLASARSSAERRGVKLTPVALIAKCVAAALASHPRLNATIADDGLALELHEEVDLGIAVASTAGLLVPVLRNVGSRSLTDVAAGLADVAERARRGAVAVSELQGGSFTLSSTGGIERARIVSTTPVLNLPHVAALWVSRIEDRPRVRGGVLEAGPVLTASLSFDHRFIDGADATAFINDLSASFEDPIGGLA